MSKLRQCQTCRALRVPLADTANSGPKNSANAAYSAQVHGAVIAREVTAQVPLRHVSLFRPQLTLLFLNKE